MFTRFGSSVSVLTVILALGTVPAPGTEYYVYPAAGLYSTGRVLESNGNYSKHNGDLMYGKDMPDSKWQGLFRFDLSDLPESLTVESATIEYQAISVSNPPPHNYVTHVAADPLVADGATLWDAIVNGTVAAPDMAHSEGWIERDLDAPGLAAIQAGISDGYVTFGIYKWDTSDTKGHIKGQQAGRFKPRIRLDLAARDIAVVRIIEPQGIYDVTDTILPDAIIENHGEVDAPFRVTFIISTGTTELYRRYIDAPGLAPGTQMGFIFPEWLPDAPGVDRVARVEVSMPGDFDSDNDMLVSWFSIRRDKGEPPNPPDPPTPPTPEYAWGWEEMTQVPMQASLRPVRLGGWLAVNPGSGVIYSAKGNGTGDFASYNPVTGRWQNLASIPFGPERVIPGKGARGTCDGGNYIYAVKGNKSTEFWRYDIARDNWERLADLPLGPNSGAVRSGSGLVFVEQWGTGYVYLLKGPKGDFVRYNSDTNAWEMLASAPIGGYNKWDRGSWLVSDGAGKLYAHKAKRHEMWTFDLENERWDATPRPAMPLVGSLGRAIKMKDGGAATWYDGALYALKGGKSQEFWQYQPATGQWAELETMPRYGSSLRNVRMGKGGDFVTYPFGGALFAIKGNKSLEFWRYTFAPASLGDGGRPGNEGVAALEGPARPQFRVAPNPVRGSNAVLNYSLPQAGPANVTVFDAAGRVVQNVRAQFERAGSRRLDVSALAAGVYLVRVEAGEASANQKLVISR
jgi:hypothetical protein